MDMSKLGGDSQNTMPIAINAGLAARKMAQAAADPAAAKFSVDAFKASLNSGTAAKLLESTQANLPISDALQQQSFIVRMASKIPFVKTWLGAEGQMNNTIGSLANDGAAMSKVELTRALYSAKTPQEIEAVVKSAKLADPEVAKQLIASAQERLAGSATGAATQATETAAKGVAKSVVKQAAQQAAGGSLGEIAASASEMTLKQSAKSVPTQKAIIDALDKGGPAARKALMKMGFYAGDADKLVAKVATTTSSSLEATGGQVIQKTTTTTTTEVASSIATKSEGIMGKIGGFAKKLLGGAKGNFIVAGVFSTASNAIQLAQGKMNVKQFIGLTAMDTAAYGAIGWGSAAAGAAIGTALFPGVGTIAGFVIGLGLGFLGGTVYDKFIRTPVKNMLAGGSAAPADKAGPTPASTSNNPYTAGGSTAPAAPVYGSSVSYEQAMAQIDAMKV